MEYTPDNDRSRSVFVWNSRDGVTPFCVHIDGIEYQHTNWPGDRYAPDYRPAVGEYIFRDTTPPEARSIAQKRLESFRGTEYYPNDPEELDRVITKMTYDLTGGPTLAVVTEITLTSKRVNE